MKRLAAAAVSVALAAAPLGALEEDPWAKVLALPVGTPLIVATASGAVVEGGLTSISDEQVVIVTNDGEPRPIGRAAVQALRATRRDSIWNGVLVGAALGFGGGAGFGAAWYHGSGRYGAKPPGYQREFISGMGVLGGVVGALIGWRVDAARDRTVVVYEASSVP